MRAAAEDRPDRRTKRLWNSCVIALALPAAIVALAAGGRALADVLPPPPDDCLAGTRPDSGHGCQYCEPNTCVDDSHCGSGLHCGPAQLCVETVSCCGGWGGCDYPESAPASCVGGACSFGICTTLSVCLPGGADADADSDAGADADADAGADADADAAGDARADAAGDGGEPTVVIGSPGCGCSTTNGVHVLWLVASAAVAATALALDRRQRRRR